MSFETKGLKPINEIAIQNAQELAGGFARVVNELPSRNYQLQLHQELAVLDIGEHLALGDTEGHVEMATSSGKTALIALLADAAVKAGKRVIIFSPKVEISNTIIGDQSDEPKGLYKFTDLVNNEKVSRHFDNQKGSPNAPVVVSTYAGLLNEFQSQNKRLGKFDLVLNDECHQSLGLKTSEAAREYMPDAVRIGFSATPDYAADRKSEEVYGTRWHEYSLRAAIEAGTCAPVRALIYETGQRLQLSDPRKEYTERELAPLIDSMSRNLTAVNISKQLVEKGRQGFIACIPGGGNAHARLMATMLSGQEVNGRPLTAVDIGSHLSREEQNTRLQAYARGEIDVLTFTRALEDGWDSQQASFAINLAPTTSPVRTTQLLGRIMRRKVKGLDSIYIDFVDRTSGVAKDQYTAMHALGIDVIDITRKLGHTSNDAVYGKSELVDISLLFDDEIYATFAKNQNRLLREVLVPRKRSDDPLVAQWETILAAEGLPAEPVQEGPSAAALKTYERVARKLADDLGRTALHAEIMVGLRETIVSGAQRRLLAGFAIRCSLEEAQIELGEHADFSAYQQLLAGYTRALHKDQIYKAMEGATYRQKFVLLLRNGLHPGNYGTPMTCLQVGKELGLTGPRIGQIERLTLSGMMHPRHHLSLDLLKEDVVTPINYQPELVTQFQLAKHDYLDIGRLVDASLQPILAFRKVTEYDMGDLQLKVMKHVKSAAMYMLVGTKQELFAPLLEEPIAYVIHGNSYVKLEEISQHYMNASKKMDAIAQRLDTSADSHKTIRRAFETSLLSPDEIQLLLNIHKPLREFSRSDDIEHEMNYAVPGAVFYLSRNAHTSAVMTAEYYKTMARVAQNRAIPTMADNTIPMNYTVEDLRRRVYEANLSRALQSKQIADRQYIYFFGDTDHSDAYEDAESYNVAKLRASLKYQAYDLYATKIRSMLAEL